MKVVVALDSFKGSLGSREAGLAVRDGVLAAVPDASVLVVTVADGGEGTLAALVGDRRARMVDCETVDALGRPLRAAYALVEPAMAVVEAARTIGLDLVAPVDETVPPRASSAGLGVQLRHALGSGADRVLVTLGGTATTDGGTGMLTVLGADVVGEPGPARGGNPLWEFAGLRGGTLPDLSRVEVLVDVTNPMVGPDGAVRVFGPQKGATPAQVQHLEDRMLHWASDLATTTRRAVSDHPGTGAAGGLGGAFLACGARLVPGFDAVAEEVGLDRAVAGADLVITGEGSIDAQTDRGKAPAGVALRARAARAIVVGLAGRVCRPAGSDDIFDAAFAIHREPLPLEQAMDPRRTAAALRATGAEVARLVAAVHRLGDTSPRPKA